MNFEYCTEFTKRTATRCLDCDILRLYACRGSLLPAGAPGVIPAKAGIQKEYNMPYYVYILTSKRNGTLYTGVTSNLTKRIWEHKEKVVDGFSKKYGIDMLVWYEIHDEIENAILREKQIKKWKRQWKLRLIEETNPDWNDLYDEII